MKLDLVALPAQTWPVMTVTGAGEELALAGQIFMG
jgi:hypothetical protein